MQKNLFILLAFCGFVELFAYTIPNVQFEVLPDGFRASIPDEVGIKEVFYVIDINEKCPALMDHITAAKGGMWTTEKSNKLQNNDQIEISVMVQYNEDVFKRTETIKIVNNKPVSTNNSENVQLYEKCHPDIPGYVANATDSANCMESQTILEQSRNSPICAGSLVFEETFDDGLLRNWKHTVGIFSLDQSSFSLCSDKATNSFVKEGIMNFVPTVRGGSVDEGRITFEKNKCTKEYYDLECDITADGSFLLLPVAEAAQIDTRHSFNFQYGRIEVRAKLPNGDWLAPLIMLRPTKKSESRHRPEIRVASIYGNRQLIDKNGVHVDGSRLYAGPVSGWRHANGNDKMATTKAEKHFGDDFHVYSLTWKKEGITASVDGMKYAEIVEDMENFSDMFFISLGISVGGQYEFPESKEKPWKNGDPQSLRTFDNTKATWSTTWNGDEATQVDYVRVYAI